MSTKIVSREELAAADGRDGKPIYVALFNPEDEIIHVYDVSSRPDFYGPEGAYAVFAARDASRALATMDLKEQASNVDDLTEDQLKVLLDWNKKYIEKYPIVGTLAAN